MYTLKRIPPVEVINQMLHVTFNSSGKCQVTARKKYGQIQEGHIRIRTYHDSQIPGVPEVDPTLTMMPRRMQEIAHEILKFHQQPMAWQLQQREVGSISSFHLLVPYITNRKSHVTY
jgi:hypothetical protein